MIKFKQRGLTIKNNKRHSEKTNKQTMKRQTLKQNFFLETEKERKIN